jgi:hypothetical protein
MFHEARLFTNLTFYRLLNGSILNLLWSRIATRQSLHWR